MERKGLKLLHLLDLVLHYHHRLTLNMTLNWVGAVVAIPLHPDLNYCNCCDEIADWRGLNDCLWQQISSSWNCFAVGAECFHFLLPLLVIAGLIVKLIVQLDHQNHLLSLKKCSVKNENVIHSAVI